MLHKTVDTSILTLPKKLFPFGRMGALKVSSTGSTVDGVFFQSGTTCTLSGLGIYDFASVQVDSGCTLQFLTATNWTVVGCAGNAVINGAVVARMLLDVSSPITATLLAGISLSATVAARQVGGTGGHGNATAATGGAAAGGFGGGGGTAVAGDAADNSSKRGGRVKIYNNTNGISASYSTNGPDGGTDGGCSGLAEGNGAGGGGAGYHGGALCFIVRGTLSTSGTGSFDVRGAVGGNGGLGGSAATNNTGCDSWGCACSSCGTSAGGGGGGGAGGNGGYLELHYSAISGSFTYLLTAGAAGSGGGAGAIAGCGGGTNQVGGVNGAIGIVNQVSPVTVQDSFI